MTEFSTAIKVDVYPHEFKLVLKALNRALKDTDSFTSIERERLYAFTDYFQDLAIEHAE